MQLQKLKQHPMIVASGLVLAPIIYVGSIGGGIETLQKGWHRLFNNKPPQPHNALVLANVDFFAAKDGATKSAGQYRANFSAILRNTGTSILYATPARSDTEIDGFKSDTPGSFPILAIAPGLGAALDAASISFPLRPGQFREGRLDWVVKYGPDQNHMTETMDISGGIGVRSREGHPFLTWTPDGKSSLPVGQVPRGVISDPADTRSAADIASQDAVDKSGRP